MRLLAHAIRGTEVEQKTTDAHVVFNIFSIRALNG